MKKQFYYFLHILISFILFTSYYSFSQNSYNRVFTVQDGLAQSQVFSLCQDKKGNIWIGTVGGGISIYNGVNFKNITKDEGLAGNSVYAIIQDKNENIWAGTDKGLTKISGKKITNYTTKDGLPENTIWKIFEDHNGTIWVGTGKGLASFKNNRFELFKDTSAISTTSISSIYEDKNNNLWIGTKFKGLYIINKNKITNYSKEKGLADNWVFDINQDINGIITISL